MAAASHRHNEVCFKRDMHWCVAKGFGRQIGKTGGSAARNYPLRWWWNTSSLACAGNLSVLYPALEAVGKEGVKEGRGKQCRLLDQHLKG